MANKLTHQHAYTRRELIRAVNLAALLGGFGVLSWLILPHLVQTGRWSQLPTLILGYGTVGIPVSFLIAWIVVAPFLRVLMRKNVSFIRASKWGAGIGICLVALSILIGRYLGWRFSINLNLDSRVGPDGAIRSIDGMLTPYGWWVLAQNSICFILICLLVSLVVRLRIGPGNSTPLSEAEQ